MLSNLIKNVILLKIILNGYKGELVRGIWAHLQHFGYFVTQEIVTCRQPIHWEKPLPCPPGTALLLVGKSDARFPKLCTLCLWGVICSYVSQFVLSWGSATSGAGKPLGKGRCLEAVSPNERRVSRAQNCPHTLFFLIEIFSYSIFWSCF